MNISVATLIEKSEDVAVGNYLGIIRLATGSDKVTRYYVTDEMYGYIADRSGTPYVSFSARLGDPDASVDATIQYLSKLGTEVAFTLVVFENTGWWNKWKDAVTTKLGPVKVYQYKEGGTPERITW